MSPAASAGSGRDPGAVPGEMLALVAVQLRLTMDDLASEEAFAACIDAAAARAASACGEARHRLLVFPEAVGHFLPLVHAPPSARRAATVDRAMAALVLRRPGILLTGLARVRRPALDHAILCAVLPAADRLMRRVFAAVARRHGATVVAGSHLRAAAGLITNTSYTFDPQGRLVAETCKVNLVPDLEDQGGLGLARGHAGGVPVVDAPWGRLATLICYDGFCVPHTAGERFVALGPTMDARGVDVVANPAANPWPWQAPWVHAPPAAPGERVILRHEQWRAEGLPATLARTRRVRYGITAHLCGRLLDQVFSGQSEILVRSQEGVEVSCRASTEDESEIVAVLVPARMPAEAGSAVPAAGARNRGGVDVTTHAS